MNPLLSMPLTRAANATNPIAQLQKPDFSLIGADRKGYEAARQKIAPDAPSATQAVEQARNPLLAVPAAIGQKTFGVDYATTPKPGAVTADAPLGNAPVNPLVRSNPANAFTETGTKMDATNPLTTINMQANNDSMAKANAIRQSMAEGDRPKIARLGDSGRAESQALMDKWGREDQVREMMQEMGRNPKAAGAIAHLMNTQQGSETARAGMESNQGIAALENDTRRRGQDVAMRGQDIEAETRAAQLAGNPLTNELTRARIDSERLSADTMRRQNGVLSQLESETDPAKRETLIENALVAQGKSLPQTERLTLEQMRTNREIHAARQKIAGLSPEEIRRKTAKQTNTGRENPDYDDGISRAVTLAGRRKIGSDDEFNQRQVQAPTAQPAGDLLTRFTADPAMKNHRLGQQTDLGTEVFDASGKLIGHYQ